MKRILFALSALAAVASAACRQYAVDVYRDVNGKAAGGQFYGVSQSFVCTADSLLWAELFVGAANDSGSYHFVIQTPDQQELFHGDADAGVSVHYEYVCAILHPTPGAPELIKGETYVLKVTLSSQNPNDSFNWYADSTNPYKYGMFLDAPPQGQSEPLCWDLAARIEGVNRAVSREFFGVNGMHCCDWDSTNIDHHYALMDTAGIGTAREVIYWRLLSPVRGSFNWTVFDPTVIAAASHHVRLQVILSDCPGWASTHFDSIRINTPNYDTFWEPGSPPRGLAEPVESAGGANPNNYFGYYVYEVVNRYKPSSAFWTSHGFPAAAETVQYYEVWNEPNYWRNPDSGYGYRVADTTLGAEDSIAIVESLYARTCDVACQAAHLADSNARLLVGSLGEVEWEDLIRQYGPRLVKGKNWLRAYYRWRDSTTTAGVSVHPYQHGENDIAFNPVVMVQELDTVRSIMKANGEEDKELWATELSWNNGDPTQTWLAPRSMPEAYTFVLAGTPTSFCNSIEWAGLMGPPARLLNPPDEKMPCYYAYQQMTKELLGKRMNGRFLSGDSVTDAKTEVYELEDTATFKKTWVGWRNHEMGAVAVAMRIPARSDKLGIAPLARSADADRLNRSVMARKDGWLDLALDTIPVYIHEAGTRARADLVVDSIWTTEDPDNSVTLRARVKSIGNKRFVSSGKKGSFLRFAIDGIPVNPKAEPQKLAPGVTAIVQSGPVSPDRSVMHLVSATANPDEEVMELNFDNNARYCPLSAH